MQCTNEDYEFPSRWVDDAHGALFALDFESAQIADFYDTQMDRKQMSSVNLEQEMARELVGNDANLVQTLNQKDRRNSVETDMKIFTQRKTSTRPIPIPSRKSGRSY
jgi:hypothetical protein